MGDDYYAVLGIEDDATQDEVKRAVTKYNNKLRERLDDQRHMINLVVDDNDLFYKLKKLRGQGILFGHQDDLAYGVGWEYIRGESDVKRVAGDYPALFGWELGGLELDHEKNLDKVPFDKMKSLLQVSSHFRGKHFLNPLRLEGLEA